jgi:hypothetical protein
MNHKQCDMCESMVLNRLLQSEWLVSMHLGNQEAHMQEQSLQISTLGQASQWHAPRPFLIFCAALHLNIQQPHKVHHLADICLISHLISRNGGPGAVTHSSKSMHSHWTLVTHCLVQNMRLALRFCFTQRANTTTTTPPPPTSWWLIHNDHQLTSCHLTKLTIVTALFRAPTT